MQLETLVTRHPRPHPPIPLQLCLTTHEEVIRDPIMSPLIRTNRHEGLINNQKYVLVCKHKCVVFMLWYVVVQAAWYLVVQVTLYVVVQAL